MNQTDLTPDDVRRVCGDLVDRQVQAILDLKPSGEEMEIAVAYAQGEDDVMGEERKPLSGNAAAIYDILTRDDLWSEENRSH